MRIVRFSYKKKINWGVLEGESIRIIKDNPFGVLHLARSRVLINEVKLLVPAVPTKIVLVGLNYKDHAKELKMKIPKEPIIFIKPATALIAHKQKIIYPAGAGRIDYEAELALVISKKAKNLKENDVNSCILGYTCFNDVTARDLQRRDIQWTRAKSFDTFAPCGPWLETDVDPDNLRIASFLNGELKQDSSTKNFIFPVNMLVSFISKIMTLLPGDIISTGTPPGVGPMKAGDLIEVEIEGIGKLKNKLSPPTRWSW